MGRGDDNAGRAPVSEENPGGGLDRGAGADHVVYHDSGAVGDITGCLLGSDGGTGHPRLAHHRDLPVQQRGVVLGELDRAEVGCDDHRVAGDLERGG